MLALAPLLVPLATALLCAMAQSRPRAQQLLSAAGAVVALLCAVALFLQVQQHGAVGIVAGNWPLPFGIEIRVDRLGAALALLAALMLTVVVIFQAADADRALWSPALHPLIHGMVAGVGGAFLTADLFNLYVWFEVALICALGLLAQGGTFPQLDGALKYFVLNVLGTLLFLAAVALVYGATGQLNFSALAVAAKGMDGALMSPLVGLLLIAFLVKAAAFPFFAWLPASYHTLPAPVLALFAALLTKLGVYGVLRVAGDVFYPAPELLLQALGWIAVASMVTGVLGAAYHWDMRRVLAFHSISQVGYILLGVALGTAAGKAAAIFFALHHSVVKGTLFLIAAIVYRLTGHYDLRRIGGLYAAHPVLGVLFLVMALALVGIPPLTGFWAKYLIVRESLLRGEYVWAGIALAVGAVTLYSMAKIWMEAFWKSHPDSTWTLPQCTRLWPAYLAVGLLAALTVAVGLFPESLIGYVASAATALGEGRM